MRVKDDRRWRETIVAIEGWKAEAARAASSWHLEQGRNATGRLRTWFFGQARKQDRYRMRALGMIARIDQEGEDRDREAAIGMSAAQRQALGLKGD